VAAHPRTAANPSVQPAPVPELVTDPVWSLRPWPVEIDLGPRVVTIPALPAADWLVHLLLEVDLDAIFPGLLPSDEEELVEDMLYDGRLSLDQLDRLFLDVIGTVSARPWWVALRLVAQVRANWAVLGADMTLRGVDPTRLSLSAWLDVALLTIMRHISAEDSTMFTLQLEMAPASETARIQEGLEMSQEAFMAMAR
jgi:hypothetical protein